eukprot:3669240-Rhodomonas_salina.2
MRSCVCVDFRESEASQHESGIREGTESVRGNRAQAALPRTETFRLLSPRLETGKLSPLKIV